jgi:hypothetical protein
MSAFTDSKSNDRKIVSVIKKSSSAVGRLYPVLIDEQGQVIDGAHRLKADPDWFKVKVPGVETEEQRLLARLVSNVCRRNVPAEEKNQMLDELGQVYIEQGVPHSELIKTIARKTGMSYRWIMKYASTELKQRPGLGGPKTQKERWENQVARRTTGDDQLLAKPSERVANLTSYSNTKFATILLDKRFYLKLANEATELGVDVDTIINNVMLQTMNRLRRLVEQQRLSTVICTTN